ncbi:hypothetical protein QE152_g22256 [Popillia japonica]|uniref:DNA-directed DNA polymerase n=1 Tax=Popillia japonica TaxID=7064 RepID=A0AAW1KLT6_POPJA
MFTLCRTCSEQLNQNECTHSDEQRALTGTWVIDEVRKSIEKGYSVLEIYEVWKYHVVNGLFREYIDEYLKIKQQATGWPLGCDSTEEKQKYIQQYLEKEGVKLNPDKIAKNPGLRQVGKAVITSFWGKLGQRENQSKTTIVNEPAQFFSLLTNPTINVNTVQTINENTLVVNWEHKEEVYDPLPTVNVCLAAYTTAQARLKLYSYLEKLDDRVLYYDTDSVIYISRPSEWDVPLGSFLGEMTDELECYGGGSYITTFASGGPKLYAYRVYSPTQDKYHDTIKVKGITINHNTSKIVNFQTLCDMVLKEGEADEPTYVTTKQISRTAMHEVVTKTGRKIFRCNFRKRKLLQDYNSVPYGYKSRKLE